MLKFNELGIESGIEGDKMPINSVLNKPIVITKYKVGKSKQKTEFCTTIQFYFVEDTSKTKHVVFTGSEVIRDNLEKVDAYCKEHNEEFEIETTLVQVGKYYSLS